MLTPIGFGSNSLRDASGTERAVAAARQMLEEQGITFAPLTELRLPASTPSLFDPTCTKRGSGLLHGQDHFASLADPATRARVCAALHSLRDPGYNRSSEIQRPGGIVARAGQPVVVPPTGRLAVLRGESAARARLVETL